MASINFDSVLESLGAEGRYQTVLYYLLCIPATIPAAFLAFNQVFLSATPGHWCQIPQLANLTIENRKALAIPFDGTKYSSCTMYHVDYNQILPETILAGIWPANTSLSQPVVDSTWPVVNCLYGWEYDKTQYDATLVTELNLVCDNKWLPSFSTTLFYVGSLFGNLLFGWIADKWGRRISFLLMIYMAVMLSIATAFSPNYTVYMVFRAINGLTFPALFQIPYILVMELVGPEFRTFAGNGISMFFGLSLALLAGLAYFLRHWFHLALATSVPFLPLFGYYWVVPESPRWLLSRNRIDEAEAIVQHIARINKRTIPPNYLRSLQQHPDLLLQTDINIKLSTEEQQEIPRHPSHQPSKGTMLELLSYPNMRRKFYILTFLWLANSVAYNGLSYNSSNLGVSDTLAFFINAIVEAPAYVLTWWAMSRWGRRWVTCLTMLLGGLACCCCMLVPEDPLWISVTLAMIGKFGIAASFGIIFLYASELLPTVVRSQAMAIASFVAGIGLIAFPYIVFLAVYSRLLPLLIMGLLATAGALCSVLLPETLGVSLPQTLEEGEAFGLRHRIWSCPAGRKRRCQKVDGVKSSDIGNESLVLLVPSDAAITNAEFSQQPPSSTSCSL
ncbi:organic cation transporter 1 isoform X1 [Daphnia magna]|uniref:organic cation transporter 1 isoform X1 n=1 Tax=Daphnia magna TaxID=35525 RepID=UPI001E1BDA03|nr:organic cation transporter 1 isoform X1 [Daphnia magna]XP_032788171.2 organic cation transporter 1 isoform X1 [Daphnia magna]XP_045031624.1 organic cation transporter 1 isoform X1 [Daphnia magna]XP_045031625.1 organic cation transporter 1 isoform X1 [Daphnia magna]XP_045031626.1 organic cation transporter 1 isoform X1 [Daphnia magna]XP_045031628.1 organic cation transporter 1 isoform X1 [Daphnia magna]XP_045031629.1 organic cation transporter 1 isoform X1 [Daphnia magna]